MKLAGLLLLPLVLAQKCEESEESMMLQKNQEALRRLSEKGKLIPAFVATMGLEVAQMTLQTACTNVEKAIAGAKDYLAENPKPQELAEGLGQVFDTMESELHKGCDQVRLGLQVQGLSSSLEDLKASMDIASDSIQAMKVACGFEEGTKTEIESCEEATDEAHEKMLKAFGEWIEAAAAELLTKVLPWDKMKMQDFNTKKIPEITQMVDSMCSKLDDLIATVSDKAKNFAEGK
eukprot:Skav203725  [mRNA]  locus=scaffold259:615785:621250:- [translate_table: standard]